MDTAYEVYKKDLLLGTVDENGGEVGIYEEHACSGHEHTSCIVQEWYSNVQITNARILGYSETRVCDGTCRAIEKPWNLGGFLLPHRLGGRRHRVEY